MASDIVSRAGALVEAIRQASRRQALKDHVQEFLTLLGGIPDYPARTFSDDELASLRHLGDEAIGSIERYVATADDGDSKEQPLVETVYEIREAIEEIERWQQHYR